MPPKGKGKKSKKQLEEEKRKFELVVEHFRSFNLTIHLHRYC